MIQAHAELTALEARLSRERTDRKVAQWLADECAHEQLGAKRAHKQNTYLGRLLRSCTITGNPRLRFE